MFSNNKRSNKALWGTILGTSLGIIISSQMPPLNRKKMMRSARKASANLMDGITSLWD
jgi:hypothetical protein